MNTDPTLIRVTMDFRMVMLVLSSEGQTKLAASLDGGEATRAVTGLAATHRFWVENESETPMPSAGRRVSFGRIQPSAPGVPDAALKNPATKVAISRAARV